MAAPAAFAYEPTPAAAQARLEAVDPAAYARSRNHLDGAVTGLGPYITHGLLGLPEVRDHLVARHRLHPGHKLLFELAWREYFRHVWQHEGEGILESLHEGPLPESAYARELPADLRGGCTGVPAVDRAVRQLHATGTLHNHARMWLASYTVHLRRVHWRAGADWMLGHLLDGDPASNHLSWQWVAGTFSAKPYLFNRENLESYTAGIHCRQCPIFGSCDVEGSYEDLTTRLFARASSAAEPRPPLRITLPSAPAKPVPETTRPLVWLTLDSAADTSPAASRFPGAPRLFVVEDDWLAAEQPSLKRLVFLFECLAEIPGVEVFAGDPREIVPARAAARGCDAVAVAESSCPRLRAASDAIAAAMPVVTRPWPTFCDRSRVRDLGRFSRYWQKAGPSAMRPTP